MKRKKRFLRLSLVFLAAVILVFCLSMCVNRENVLAANIVSSTNNVKNYFFRITNPAGFSLKDPYYVSGTKEDRGDLEEFFSLLVSEADRSQEQFTVIREIANTYIRQKEYGKLVNFLSSRIHQYPEDTYTAYYIFMMAYGYQQMEAYPVATIYFDMIVKNYPDLTIQGRSIHLASLNQLISLVEDPRQRVWYYEELIDKYQDQIDPGPSYFMLAQAYEGIGEWNSAIRAYTQYLSYTGSNVPGFPNADNYAKQLVDFNNSAKDWSFESLNVLVDTVKTALDDGSSNRLWQYHAKANFFTRTWENEDIAEGGVAGHAVFNLSDFMRGNRIRYAENIDVSSNANEAYLRTWGWSQNISTWYLCFRKIHFPMDPEMHGRWEWAGIYYGEKF